MNAHENRLGSKRWNEKIEHYQKRFWEKVAHLEKAMLADGPPPFYEERSPVEQMQQLRAMRAAGDPNFWNNPQAQADLALLEERDRATGGVM